MSQSNVNFVPYRSARIQYSWIVMGAVLVAMVFSQPTWAQDFGLGDGSGQKTPQRQDDRQSGVSADGKFDVKVVGATRTIKVKDTDRDIEIIETQNGPVSVSVSRTYTSNDMDELARKSPKLAEFLSNIPPTMDGLSVDLSVRLSNNGSADNESDLEKKHKGLFNIYKRYLRELRSVNLLARGARRSGGGLGGRLGPQDGYRSGTTATSKAYDIPTARVGPDNRKKGERVDDQDDRDR